MQELLVDFITSLDGYGAAEGWPGYWGLQGPEYLAWLGEQPERDYTILMGGEHVPPDVRVRRRSRDARSGRSRRRGRARQDAEGGVLVDVAAPVGLGEHPA